MQQLLEHLEHIYQQQDGVVRRDGGSETTLVDVVKDKLAGVPEEVMNNLFHTQYHQRTQSNVLISNW